MNRGAFETSQFYMWRCVIAMAHADGKVTPEETAYVEEKVKRFKTVYEITEDQIHTLLGDLKSAQDPADMLRHINDPKFRGQTIYFARLLAYADGELSPSEADLLKHMHLQATDGLDMDAIKKEATHVAEMSVTEMDLKGDINRPQGWMLFGLLDKLLVHLGVDLMDE